LLFHKPSGIPTTHFLLILERIYTGSTVPDGIGGSSVYQSNTPQPSFEVQAEKTVQANIRKSPQKRLFFSTRIGI
jgi:hypothetical protein